MTRLGSRRAGIWLLYVLFICLTTLVGLELIIRLLGLAPPIENQYKWNVPDPYLPYKPKPFIKLTGRSASDEFDFNYSHNSFGFRDVEHTLKKPAGTFRIIGLGDSFTYGTGARFEETYLYQLEKMLNERKGKHPHVEIIKAGISRYFAEPERILLEHYGVRYSPDLVLVEFMPNDVIDTYFGMNFLTVDSSGFLITREAQKLGRLGKFFYKHSQLARIVLRKYVNLMISREYQPHYDAVYEPNGYHEKDWRTLLGEYDKMIRLSRKAGAKIAFAYLPQPPPWGKKDEYPARRLSKWAAEKGVTFINLLPAMKAASRNAVLYYKKDGHCRPAGYRVIAETLSRELAERGLVP